MKHGIFGCIIQQNHIFIWICDIIYVLDLFLKNNTNGI